MFMFLKNIISGFIPLVISQCIKTQTLQYWTYLVLAGEFFYADPNYEHRGFWQKFSSMFITALNKVRSIIDLQAFE